MRNPYEACVTEGERIVWKFFNDKLSDDFWVWTNVNLMIQRQGSHESNEIDLILYHKDIGVEVFSIKDWRIKDIKDITKNRVVLRSGIKANPFLNAQQHRYAVQSKLKKKQFLDDSGRPQVCVNSGVILPFITRDEFIRKLKQLKIDNPIDVCTPLNAYLFKDEFGDRSVLLNDHQCIMKLRNIRDRRYTWVAPFNKEQLNFLDTLLSEASKEETFIKDITSDSTLSRVDNSIILKLDEKQKEIAHKYLEKIFKKSGHRLIKGIAGSGKTIMLEYIFAEIAKVPQYKILFIVYNNALMRSIKEVLEELGVPTDHPNYKIYTFHGYCYALFGKENMDNLRTTKASYLDDDKLTEYINEHIDEVPAEYDFVLIDEGQDLRDEWIRMLVKSAKEGGNVVYTEDFEQNLYGRRRVYSNAGLEVKGQGRESESLLINYRNSKQISYFALKYSNKYTDSHTSRLNNLRQGPVPEVITGPNSNVCAKYLLDKIVFWENMGYSSGSIAIIYPYFHEDGITNEMFRFFEAKQRKVNCIMNMMPYAIYKDKKYYSVWHHEEKLHVNDSRFVKMSTLHSSKGLDFDCVILVCEKLERFWNEEKIYNALYVGSTRARFELALTFTGEDKYGKRAQDIINSMKNNEL